MASLRRNYLSTLATNGSILLMGTVSGILVARLLGPAGRGELAAVTIWPLTLGLLGSLGLNQAITYFSAKRPDQRSQVWSSALTMLILQSLTLFLVGYFALPWILRGHSDKIVRLAQFFLLYLPVGFALSYFQNILQGSLHIRLFNLVRAITAGVYVAGIAVLFLRNQASLPLVCVLLFGSYVVGTVLGYTLVHRQIRPRWQWDSTFLRTMLRYAFQAFGGHVAQVLFPRVVILMMTLFLPVTEIGYYAVGYTLAGGLLIVPAGVGAVTLARATAAPAQEAHQVLGYALRFTLGLLLPAAAVLYLLAPRLLPFLFGAEFLPAVATHRILLVGILGLALTQVLYEGLRSLNHPQGPSYAGLIGIGCALVFLALLLPRFGHIGGAVAFSLSCFVTLAMTLGYAFFRAHISWRVLLRSSSAVGTADMMASIPLAENPPLYSLKEKP